MEAIKLSRVSKYYHQGDQVSVGMKHISLTFHMGEFIAVTGESGSGKSTLLNVLSGLDKYEEGEMFIFGEETSHFEVSDFEKYRREYVGFVFQNYNIIDSYTVMQNVLLALELQDYPKEKRKERASELINLVGLNRQKHQKSSKLSGGQKQRAVIARALAKDTPILVADEPTGNLDQESAAQIIQLLKDIAKQKLVILVTHEYDQVKDVATRRIKMSDGEVVEDKTLKPHEEVTEKPLVKDTKTSLLQIIGFALRNLLSQPKRFVFMLLLLTIAISVFTVVYSNQVYNLRTQGLEQSYIYPKVPASRVLVERRDGEALTEDDMNLIMDQSGVDAVYSYGDLFYNSTNLILSSSNEGMYYGETFYVEYTDSAETLSTSDLLEGRLPEAINEVVISPSFWEDIRLNQTFYAYIDEYNYYVDESFGTTPNYVLALEVVGITNDNTSTLYFSESYLNQSYPTEPFEIAALKSRVEQQLFNTIRATYEGVDYYIEPALYSDDFDIDFNIYGSGQTSIKTINVTFKALSINGVNLTFQKELDVNIPEGVSYDYALINPSLYYEIIDGMLLQIQDEFVGFPPKIASVNVSNQLAGNRLIESLDSTIFKVYYPSNLSSPFQEFLIFMLSIVAIVVLLLLGLFLYAVIHAVTRNMMTSRKKDFSIFRSVGAHQSTLSWLVIVEQVLLSMFGLAIAVGFLQLIVGTVNNHGLTIEYMLFRDYIILLVAIVYLGTWLGVRFNKKVFNQTVIQALSQGGDDA